MAQEGIAGNSSLLNALLQRQGLTSRKAAALTAFLVGIATYIHANPKLEFEIASFVEKHPTLKASGEGVATGIELHDVYKGALLAVKSSKYSGMLNQKIRTAGWSGGANALGMFVDQFGAYAKSQNIEVNQCALQVARVASDIAAAGVGSVTSVSGIGIPLLGYAIVSTYQDSYSLGKACF